MILFGSFILSLSLIIIVPLHFPSPTPNSFNLIQNLLPPSSSNSSPFLLSTTAVYICKISTSLRNTIYPQKRLSHLCFFFFFVRRTLIVQLKNAGYRTGNVFVKPNVIILINSIAIFSLFRKP